MSVDKGVNISLKEIFDLLQKSIDNQNRFSQDIALMGMRLGNMESRLIQQEQMLEQVRDLKTRADNQDQRIKDLEDDFDKMTDKRWGIVVAFGAPIMTGLAVWFVTSQLGG